MFYRVIVCYLCLQKNALAFKEIGRRTVVTGRGKADFRRTPAEGMKKRIEGISKARIRPFFSQIITYRAGSWRLQSQCEIMDAHRQSIFFSYTVYAYMKYVGSPLNKCSYVKGGV